MTFRMHCPKCRSLNCEIETDQTHYFGGSRNHAQLHCRNCGKIVYGKAAVEVEARMQYAAWEAQAGEREAAEAAKKAEQERLRQLKLTRSRERTVRQKIAREQVVQRVPMIPTATPKEQGVGEIAMSCSLGSCSTVIWVSPERKAQIRATTKRVFCCHQHETEWSHRTKEEGHTCSWKDCGELARAKSLYCSRDCSNKNARWRHAVRKDAVKRREASQMASPSPGTSGSPRPPQGA